VSGAERHAPSWLTAGRVAVASSVHGRVQRRQQDKRAQPVQAAPQPAPASIGASFDTKLAQLKQLGELRDAGILTELEFEVKKAEILNS
jgi:hypothetical protein